MEQSTVTIAWVKQRMQALLPALAINASQSSQAFAKEELSRGGLDHVLYRFQQFHVLLERQDIAHVDALLYAISPMMIDVKGYLDETAELGEFDDQDERINEEYDKLLTGFSVRGFTDKSLVLETPAHPDPMIARLPLFESDKESYYDPLYALKSECITLCINKEKQGERTVWCGNKQLGDDILTRLTHAIRTGRAILDSEARDPKLECVYRHFTLKPR